MVPSRKLTKSEYQLGRIMREDQTNPYYQHALMMIMYVRIYLPNLSTRAGYDIRTILSGF